MLDQRIRDGCGYGVRGAPGMPRYAYNGWGPYFSSVAVVIGKRGKLKGAVSPVLEINDAYADIQIIVRDICPSGCDYCVIEPSSQIEDSFGVLLSYCGSLSADL